MTTLPSISVRVPRTKTECSPFSIEAEVARSLSSTILALMLAPALYRQGSFATMRSHYRGLIGYSKEPRSGASKRVYFGWLGLSDQVASREIKPRIHVWQRYGRRPVREPSEATEPIPGKAAVPEVYRRALSTATNCILQSAFMNLRTTSKSGALCISYSPRRSVTAYHQREMT